MLVLAVALLALLVSSLTYGWLEPAQGRRGLTALRRHWIPLAGRWLAWAGLGLLLLDLSCAARRSPGRPLVLLDASLSMAADSGRWLEARDSSLAWGSVRLFGDERVDQPDTTPVRGRSRLAPALRAAAASDRPVIVVTDGELEDGADLPPDLGGRARVRLFPRRAGSDVAITGVEHPARVTAGDSIPLVVTVTGFGAGLPGAAGLEVAAGGRVLARLGITPVSGGVLVPVVLGSAGLAAGENLLDIRLTGIADAEPRDDARRVIVAVTPTPGVVLLAGSADWDSRTLYRTLLDVAQLPVRGYVRVEADRWRSYANLAPVAGDEVRRAARGADLLVVTGDPSLAAGTRARGIWHWPSEGRGAGATALPGDWYITPGSLSPIAGAFTGLPVDSFPPAVQVLPIQPEADGWVALTAQNGRRGADRPVMVGRSSGGRREITVAADGLWRWAFRGGSSEQGYRTWVAATTSWLLGGVDSVTGKARPVRPVVANQRPVIFQWLADGQPVPLEIVWTDSAGARRDTLEFDGAGQAAAWLPPGAYRYRLEGGGSGLVAVEKYSEEWLPRAVTLAARTDAPFLAGPVPSRARGWIWLFGLCVAGFGVEWLARRRLGLR